MIRVSLREPCLTAPRRRFEFVREVEGAAVPGLVAPSPLQTVTVECARIHERLDGISCAACPEFVNWVAPRAGSLLVRCLWTENDPVRAAMTPIRAPAELYALAAGASLEEVRSAARAAKVRRLAVLEGDRLVGTIARSELAHGFALELVQALRAALPLEATLGDAAGLLGEHRLDWLPVVRGENVAGVLTRGDLLRLGVPASALA